MNKYTNALRKKKKFDPEGDGYDYETTKKARLKDDNNNSGLI